MKLYKEKTKWPRREGGKIFFKGPERWHETAHFFLDFSRKYAIGQCISTFFFTLLRYFRVRYFKYTFCNIFAYYWMFLVDCSWKDIIGLLFGFSQTISCRATYRDVIFSFLGDSRQKNVKNARHVRLCLSSPPLVLLNWPHLSSTARLLYARESDYCIPWQIETTTILVTLIGHVAATHSAAAPVAISMNICAFFNDEAE